MKKYFVINFPKKEEIVYYATYHRSDIEDAAERMMDAGNQNTTNVSEKGVENLRRLYHESPSQ